MTKLITASATDTPTLKTRFLRSILTLLLYALPFNVSDTQYTVSP